MTDNGLDGEAIMGRMVRKQINIDEDLDQRLQQLAEDMNVSQSELVRQAVGSYLDQTQTRSRQDALEALKEHWAEADCRGISSGGKRWTREEIHERPGDIRRRERADLRRGSS